MISETPIFVIVVSITPSALELESTGFGFVAEEDDPVEISEEEVATSPLLSGVIAEELSGVTGMTGLDSSSEQAENRPSAVAQVPTASHFFVFMSAFLF